MVQLQRIYSTLAMAAAATLWLGLMLASDGPGLFASATLATHGALSLCPCVRQPERWHEYVSTFFNMSLAYWLVHRKALQTAVGTIFSLACALSLQVMCSFPEHSSPAAAVVMPGCDLVTAMAAVRMCGPKAGKHALLCLVL